jgi:hypothetical protein
MRAFPGTIVSLIAVVAGALLLGCGTDSDPDPAGRGQVIIPRGDAGRAGSTYSCVGACGQQAAGGCYCDDACADWGDCCPDKIQACDPICPADLCAVTCAGQPLPAGCPTPKCACCPSVVAPSPDFCPGGVIKPVFDAAGKCITEYACQSCPKIAGPDPDFCSGGTIEPVYDQPGADCMMIKVSDPASLPCGKVCPGGYQTINGTPTCTCCGTCVTGFTCQGCPKIAAPAQDFCPAGIIKPVYDSAGKCITEYACQGCPKIAGPADDFCPAGLVVPVYDPTGRCITEYACQGCPKIAGPAEGFCPSGVVVPVYDPSGKCITEYSCQSCPKIAGPAQGFCPQGVVASVLDAVTKCPTGFKCLPNISCKGFCGGQAPGNCWCDSSCAAYGDCCGDKPVECK